MKKHRGVEQLVARQAHNLEVARSNPASATTEAQTRRLGFFVFVRYDSRVRPTVGSSCSGKRFFETMTNPASATTETQTPCLGFFVLVRPDSRVRLIKILLYGQCLYVLGKAIS